MDEVDEYWRLWLPERIGNDHSSFVMVEFMTSTEVATTLKVGASTVKRWSDSGLLACERTRGGHRRYLKTEVERMRLAAEGPPSVQQGGVDVWAKFLCSAPGPVAVQGALLTERRRLGSWWAVCDHLGEVLGELGRKWSAGEISILAEHTASEHLARGIARCSEAVPTGENAARCLLVAAESEDHLLALSLAELCLSEQRWSATWGGRSLPLDEMNARISEGTFQMVAVSSSSAYSDGVGLQRQYALLRQACSATGARLVLGGSGPWPAVDPEDAICRRVRSFREFHALLTEVGG